MTPRYVEHDGARWHVDGELTLDGRLAYELSKPRGFMPGKRAIVAFASDCIPSAPPARVRKFRDSGIVLELTSRGQVYIRKHGSRKRYETSLEAIFSMTVKAHVALGKALKAAAKRKGKR